MMLYYQMVFGKIHPVPNYEKKYLPKTDRKLHDKEWKVFLLKLEIS